MGSLTENNYGKRLIPNVIDDFARSDPHRECFQIPKSSDPRDGWRVISWKDYAKAVDSCAHKIVETCGEAPLGKFPTIAYIGPNDGRYLVILVAAVKAGYKVLFISPRNPQSGQINLFETTDCHVLAYAKSYAATVQPWLHEREMKAIEVGDIETWFPAGDVPPFPYNKTFEQGEWDPLLVLHTSGSTGLPKPITVIHGMLAISDVAHNHADWNGLKILQAGWAEKSKRHFSPMPLFHAGGIYFFFTNAIYWNRPIVLGIADRPLSSDLVVECLNNVDVESAFLPPSILEDMSRTESRTKALAKLNCVVFGGGLLVKEAGDYLVKNGVVLYNLIGATEFAPYPIYIQPNPELWQYFIFNSELLGAEWRPLAGEDNVFQLFSVRKGEKPGFQGFFYTFPDASEYDTKDLYRPHPTLPNHWMYHGRSDNIIVFSNGEKLNPVTFEETVAGRGVQLLKGAMVVGANRFQAALLIEPVITPKSEQEETKLIDEIWPLVEQANKESVAHGRISREYISVSSPEKPFLRAGKQTIQRAATVKLYEDEINRLYEKAAHVSTADAPKVDISSQEALSASIVEIFRRDMEAATLESDQDFFSAGIDSLQVMTASRLLKAGLEEAGCKVDSSTLAPRVIYGNPTPSRLAQYVMASIINKGAENGHAKDSERQIMAKIRKKYTENLTAGKPGRPNAADQGQTVLITGTTGMLGSYVLDLMARSPNVKKIICLNRDEDGGASRQANAMETRGLDPNYTDKAEFYHCDMSRPDFGLAQEVYDRLLKDADRVIHNAWPVNFNITVETFEPHIRGVRNVADFAAEADKRVAVVFISSIATCDKWDTSKHGSTVPERRFEDLGLPGMGYSQSKMVASLVLEDAAEAGDFPAAVIRVGQIAGPESEAGAWNRHEWFPSIVASSLYLGAMPADLGFFDRVDWTPAERIAKLVVEVGGVTQKVDDISGYYHGVNPSTTSWAKLAPAVQAFYGKDRIRELVSFKEWIGLLEKSQTGDAKAVGSNPGTKLIDSYRWMAAPVSGGSLEFDTTKTQERSRTMRESTAVTEADMTRWCKQWAF